MAAVQTIISLLIVCAVVESQAPSSIPTTPAPAPTPTAVVTVAPSTRPPALTAPTPGPVAPQPQNSLAPVLTPTVLVPPALEPTPAAPVDANQPPPQAIPVTDYPISRCGPVYTNEWCPPGPQGQTLYCSRWGFCAEGNKADEFAGLFVDINAVCSSLTDAECKTKNPKYFCYVPEMRCALKVSHEQVKQSSQQKSGAVSTSISAALVTLFIVMRVAHI